MAYNKAKQGSQTHPATEKMSKISTDSCQKSHKTWRTVEKLREPFYS